MHPIPIAVPLRPRAEPSRNLALLPPERARRELTHPTTLPRPTWSTPTREASARALLRAARVESRDAGQRILLRDMLAHFREACLSAGHADPLAHPDLPRRRERPELAATG